MDLKFDRRAVLKTVGAALAGGVSACTTRPAELADEGEKGGAKAAATTKVNLICHGMMLFWYDEERRERYRILIPRNSGNVHQLRMGRDRSAVNSKLIHGNPSNKTRYFTLSFGAKDVTPRTKTDGTSNVVFYPRAGVRAEPTYGTPQAPGDVAVVIDIPYPERRRFERKETYGESPYRLDLAMYPAAKDFGIDPRTIPRTTILTFTVEDTTQDIALLDGAGRVVETFYAKGTMPSYTNLYLYNQPLKPEHYGMVHLSDFSKMLLYGPGGKEKAVELMMNNNSQVTCISRPTASPADGWVADDVKSLAEIESGMPVCDFPNILSDKEKRPTFDTRGVDPAACIQGWGS